MTARHTLLEAGRYLNEGRAAEAIALLEPLQVALAHEPVRLRHLAIGCNIAGQTSRSVDSVERSITVALPLGQAEEVVWARSLLASLRSQQGRPDEAMELLTQCLAGCEGGVVLDVALRVETLASIARRLTALGRSADALEAYERAVELARQLEKSGSRAELYAQLATTAIERDTRNGEYYRQKSVFVLEECRLMRSLADLMVQAAAVYDRSGNAARAGECRDRAAELEGAARR